MPQPNDNGSALIEQHQAMLERLVQQHNVVAQAEEGLRGQHDELMRILTELGEMHLSATLQPQQSGELEELRAETDRLRLLVNERDEELQSLVQKADQAEMADVKVAEQLQRLQGEVTILRQQVQAKDKEIQELKKKSEEGMIHFSNSDDPDIEEYEAELNRFRRQLEQDRHALNEESAQLRTRNQELREVAKQSELELSRERAQMARERIQLDRLREELRMEVERAQRDANVRDRLQSVQRLKERLGGE